MFKRFSETSVVVLYFFATLQFVRFYSVSTVFYLNMSAYLHGRERLPFQERVFPILFLRPLYESSWVMRHLVHSNGPFTAARGPFYLLSLASLIVAAIYTQRLYLSLTTSCMLAWLVFPVLLFTVMWTYTIHSEANFSYPYDLPSLAFFTAGLYYIHRRQYVGIVLVVLLGTFNRETTLFLIGLYCIDSAMVLDDVRNPNSRFDLRLISSPRLALLCVIWCAVKLTLVHLFQGNDHSESFLRLSDNLYNFKPRLLPALLNICGYTLPVVLLFRKRIASVRFRNYLWIVPAWLAVMLCSGVILETRIYGELCSYCSAALVLMLEDVVRDYASAALRQQSNHVLLHAEAATQLECDFSDRAA